MLPLFSRACQNRHLNVLIGWMILAARTSVPPWGPGETLHKIDHTLSELNVSLFDLPWDTYDYVDGDHFDWPSFDRFSRDVASKVPKGTEPVCILTDSTVDWFGQEGHDHLQRIVQETTQRSCVVDAVCGSGFCARTEINQHFRARLSRRLRRDPKVPLLVVIGGWNDALDERFKKGDRLTEAVTSFVHLYHRYCRL